MTTTGDTYGDLTVVEFVETTANYHDKWLVRCKCGNEKVVFGTNMRRGKTTSCGCLPAAIGRAQLTTHGLTSHPLYVVWK